MRGGGEENTMATGGGSASHPSVLETEVRAASERNRRDDASAARWGEVVGREVQGGAHGAVVFGRLGSCMAAMAEGGRW
jgi:hypothetical protein